MNKFIKLFIEKIKLLAISCEKTIYQSQLDVEPGQFVPRQSA